MYKHWVLCANVYRLWSGVDRWYMGNVHKTYIIHLIMNMTWIHKDFSNKKILSFFFSQCNEEDKLVGFTGKNDVWRCWHLNKQFCFFFAAKSSGSAKNVFVFMLFPYVFFFNCRVKMKLFDFSFKNSHKLPLFPWCIWLFPWLHCVTGTLFPSLSENKKQLNLSVQGSSINQYTIKKIGKIPIAFQRSKSLCVKKNKNLNEINGRQHVAEPERTECLGKRENRPFNPKQTSSNTHAFTTTRSQITESAVFTSTFLFICTVCTDVRYRRGGAPLEIVDSLRWPSLCHWHEYLSCSNAGSKTTRSYSTVWNEGKNIWKIKGKNISFFKTFLIPNN